MNQHEIDRRREERFARFAPSGPDRRMSRADRYVAGGVFALLILLTVLDLTLRLDLLG